MSTSLTCIKSNANGIVKSVLVIALGICWIPFSASQLIAIKEANAVEPTPIETPSSSPSAAPKPNDEEDLPDIEARTHNVKVIRKSKSNRIYLFESQSDSQPDVGRILLLKKEDQPYLALRVLKTYPEEKKLAAKRVKKYGRQTFLKRDEEFTAIEKISDLIPPPPSEQDNSDLDELETDAGLKSHLPETPQAPESPDAFDPDLDSGTSPHPEANDKESDHEAPDPFEDENIAIAVEEVKVLDRHSHWLTAGFGYVRNNGPPTTGGSYYFSSGNLRYGYNLDSQILLNQPRLQDSLTLEGGTFFYKALSYASSTDAYTVAALSLALRYNVLFSESFGLFIYAGALRSFVISSSQATTTGFDALNSLAPSFGAGILLQIGPSWFARADIGLDNIGINLLLRF